MKQYIIFIVCMTVLIASIFYIVKQGTPKPVQVQVNPSIEIIKPKLDGSYLHHYLWSGKAGDDVNLMFDWLYDNGWKFGCEDKQASFITWIERIKSRYPDLIDKGVLKRDQAIDFSPIERESDNKLNSYVEINAWVTFYQWNEKSERKWKGKTSLGKSSKNEIGCAVDPRLIPYGSKIYIPGYGTRIADDTGSKCKEYGKRGLVLIDIRCVGLSSAEINRLGKKKMKIKVRYKKN